MHSFDFDRVIFLLSGLELSDTQKSMSRKYEPSSEPLHQVICPLRIPIKLSTPQREGEKEIAIYAPRTLENRCWESNAPKLHNNRVCAPHILFYTIRKAVNCKFGNKWCPHPSFSKVVWPCVHTDPKINPDFEQVMCPATSQEEVFTEIEPFLQSVMDGSAPTLQ